MGKALAAFDTLALYRQSELVEKVRMNLFMLVSDVDNTLRGDGSPEELRQREQARLGFSKRGATILSSARPTEMMISERLRAASRRVGFDRPDPRVVDLAHCAFCEDPDGTAEFGANIHLRCADVYRPDEEYGARLGLSTWRSEVIKVLEQLELARSLSVDTQELSFEQKRCDVLCPAGRLSLEFNPKANLLLIGDSIRNAVRSQFPALVRNLRIIDESKPEKGQQMLHLVPRLGTKAASYNWLIQHVAEALGRKTSELSTLFAGDSATDADAGLAGGLDAKSTFLVVGRLGEYLSPHGKFAGKVYGGKSWFATAKHMREADHLGVYTFKVSGQVPRRIVIAAERYQGMSGAGALCKYLDDTSLWQQKW